MNAPLADSGAETRVGGHHFGAIERRLITYWHVLLVALAGYAAMGALARVTLPLG